MLTQCLCAKLKPLATNLHLNLDDVIMLYFENMIRLPTSKSGCYSEKNNRLRHLWSKLNTDFTLLVVTQIAMESLEEKK